MHAGGPPAAYREVGEHIVWGGGNWTPKMVRTPPGGVCGVPLRKRVPNPAVGSVRVTWHSVKNRRLGRFHKWQRERNG